MKLERLISMIYMLLNHEVLSASALAEKYQVSPRTIYRDMDIICAAGIPVVSYQGVHGGYGIMEQYKMDKSLLGSYDVASLITILHSMSTVFEDEQAQETIHKLQTIQHDERVQSLSMDIGGSRGSFNASLRLLRTSIMEHRVVSFDYINAKNEKMTRLVEPARLLYKYSTWYLYGFCRIRQAFREFRVSRMVQLTSTDEPFKPHADAQAVEKAYAAEHSLPMTEVVLQVSADALARALDYFFESEKSFQEDGSLLLTTSFHQPAKSAWLLSVLLGFGESVEVIAPAELRAAFTQKLEKILQRYSKV